MSTIRERLGLSPAEKTTIRDRLGLNDEKVNYAKQYIIDNQDYKKKSSDLRELAKSKNIETNVIGSTLISSKSPFFDKINTQGQVTQNNRFSNFDYDASARKNRYELNNLKNTEEYKKLQQDTEKAYNKRNVSKYNYQVEQIENDDVNFWDKSGGRVLNTVSGMFDFGGKKLVDENGDEYYVPSLSQVRDNKISRSYDTKIGKFASDAVNELTKIGVSTAINSVAPGLGEIIYYGDMYLDVKNSALQQGYDEKSSLVYGVVNVGWEYIMDKLLGGATKTLTGGKVIKYDELLEKAFSKIIKNPKVVNVLSNAGNEATQEFFQEYLGNFSKLLILDKSTNIKDYGDVIKNKEVFEDALYSAAVGGVTGGVLGSISDQDTNVENNDLEMYETYKKELEETKKNTNDKNEITKIDGIINNIDKAIELQTQINEYQQLQQQNKLTKAQEKQLAELQEKLNELQGQSANQMQSGGINLPTVSEIVEQENVSVDKTDSSSINMPIVNKNDVSINMPTVDNIVKSENGSGSSLNVPYIAKQSTPQIRPQIISEIEVFQNNSNPRIKSYSGNQIKQMLEAVNIEVPASFDYVTEVRPDLSFTTSKELMRNQNIEIDKTLQKLKTIDVNSVNNINAMNSTVNVPSVSQNNINVPTTTNTYSETLQSFDNQQSKSILSKKDNVIVTNRIQLEALVREALIDNQSHKNLHLGIIPTETINRIKKEITNIKKNKIETLFKDDIEYALAINQDEIRHMKKDSLTVDDIVTFIDNLDELIANFDTVSYTVYNNNQNALRFKKNMNDGTHIALEVISNKNHTLRTHTLFLESADFENKKRSIFPTSNEPKKFPRHTSKMDGLSASSDNNIPQSNNNVKSDILMPTTSNMQENKNNDIKMPVEKKNSKEAIRIAKVLNETKNNNYAMAKERRWIDTSLESEPVKDRILIGDLNRDKITYVVQSNKKTLDQANNKLDLLGYEEAVNYIQKQINDDKASLTDIALAERLIQEAIKKGDNQLASDLIMDTAIMGTDLGQKVQALSLIQRLTPEGQLKMYQKIVRRAKIKGDKSFENVEITPEMVDLILNAYNKDGGFEQSDLNNRVEQFKQKIAEQLTTTKSEKIVAWRYLSMLGNPKTHIRNVVSNIAMYGTLKVKNSVARTVETIVPIKNRTKTWKKASQDVIDFAKTTTEEMKDIITGETKYNEKASIESKKQVFKNKYIEKIKDFNSDMLSKEDWIFSKNAFENTFKEYLTAQGIKTQQDISNNPEIIENAKLYALKQAEIATFRQYSWLANQINKIENKNFMTKLAVGSTIPFKKTPINVAKTGVNYSPIGLIKSLSYDAYQVRKGNMEASQMIDNFSQGLTGTSLAIIGYALAKAGILKGAGDDDKEGKYDSYLGNQTYSIKIGDATYSISWLSPVAMPLLVGATAYETLEEKADWDMNVLIDTLSQTLDPLSEMSFLSSLDDVLSSYDSGIKKFTGMIGSMGQNYITQFIPTLFSQFASTLDDTKRTTRASNDSSFKFAEETLNKIKYKIPFVRNTLEASTDIWGNEMKQSDNIITRAFESFIAPYSKKTDITSSLDNELKRLYNETGETGVIPGIPNGYIKYKDATYQLSAEEYTKLKKTYGTTAYDYLNSLLDNDLYKNSSEEEKAKMVKEVFEYASTIAKDEYFSNKDIDVEYTTDTSKKINKLKELNMSNNQITEYIASQKVISTIRDDKKLTSQEKKKQIGDIMLDSNLKDNQLAYLYSSYYSTEETLNNIVKANIPIKEFIKFDSEEFTSDYYTNGKIVPNSRKNKVINYVNGLKLTVPQKAMLIKMEYSSYDQYNSQIVNYINKLDYSKFEKASMLKQVGFDNYDKYLINEVNSRNISAEEKAEILKELGFTIRNGKVYS